MCIYIDLWIYIYIYIPMNSNVDIGTVTCSPAVDRFVVSK